MRRPHFAPARIIDVSKRFRPHVAEPWTMALVTSMFAIGVLIVSWHGRSLRLETDGVRFGWTVLIAFGMTWHGDLTSSWRMMGGLIGGGLAGIAGYYVSLSILPVTPLGLAIGLALTAAGVAVGSHVFHRTFSFAAAVVGFGVGIALSGQFPLRPTTPVDDLVSLALIVGAAFAMGSLGSVALREFVMRMGARGHSEFSAKLIRLMPHRSHSHRRAAGGEVEGAAR